MDELGNDATAPTPSNSLHEWLEDAKERLLSTGHVDLQMLLQLWSLHRSHSQYMRRSYLERVLTILIAASTDHSRCLEHKFALAFLRKLCTVQIDRNEHTQLRRIARIGGSPYQLRQVTVELRMERVRQQVYLLLNKVPFDMEMSSTLARQMLQCRYLGAFRARILSQILRKMLDLEPSEQFTHLCDALLPDHLEVFLEIEEDAMRSIESMAISLLTNRKEVPPFVQLVKLASQHAHLYARLEIISIRVSQALPPPLRSSLTPAIFESAGC